MAVLTSVAAGRFDDYTLARYQNTVLLSLFHHAFGDTVFNRTANRHEFDFANYSTDKLGSREKERIPHTKVALDPIRLGKPVKSDEGGVSNAAQRVVEDQRSGGAVVRGCGCHSSQAGGSDGGGWVVDGL